MDAYSHTESVITQEGFTMFNYLWPIGLVIIANVMYQICAKEVPPEMNAFDV